MKTEKDILMYYQTTIRNVGLYTSVSLALLGYSRFYRGKSQMYNISFIILSLLLLFIAKVMCYMLIHDIKKMKKNLEDPIHLDKWVQIAYGVLCVDILVALFGIITLIRELRNSN
jgi:hypothetical protein